MDKRKIREKIRKIDKGIVLLILVYIITTPFLLTPWIHGYDGVGYFSYLRSAVIDKDLNLENEYAHYKEIFPDMNIKISENTGRVTNQFTIGTAILWSPFYILTHIFARGDGYSFPYVFSVALSSSLYALAALILIYKMLRGYFDRFTSCTAILAIWFGTHLLFYMFLQPSVSISISMFVVTLFIYYWHKTLKNRKISEWILLGVIGAFLPLVRHQDGLFLAIPLAESIIRYYNIIKKTKRLSPVLSLFYKNLIFLITIIMITIPQFMVWNYHNGSPFSGADVAGFDPMTLIKPTHILEVLFATHGLISWTPVIALALVGLWFFYKKDKELCLYLLLGLILQLYLISTWKDWIGGAAFGQRRLVNCMVIYMFGLAAFISWLSRKKTPKFVIISAAALFIAWNFGFLIQYGSRMIPNEGPVSYLAMIKNNFTEVPKKLFDIIRTFIFERGRFLKN